MQPEFVVQTKNLCKAFAGKEVIHDCLLKGEQSTDFGEKTEPEKRLYSKSCWGC